MSELPQGWVETTLGDLFEITSSKRVHQHEWTSEGVPFYRAREIKRLARSGFVESDLFISEELFEKYSSQFGAPVSGDLMVTAVGTLGECYQVREGDRFYFKDASVLWLRKQADANTDYIAKLFLSKFVLDQVHKGGGTTVGTYTIANAKETVVPLPPLPEQRQIVAKINSLTGKSRRAHDHLLHIPRLVEKYKQAVLAAAFRGDLTREWRAQNGVTAYQRTVFLRDVLTDIRYGTAKKCDYDGGATPVLRIPNVQKGEIVLDDLKSADFEDTEHRKLRLQPGDLLLIRSNGSLSLVGRCAIVSEAAAGMLFAGYLIRLRFDAEIVVPRYVHLWFQSGTMRSIIEGLAKSTSGVNNINSTQIEQLPIKLTSLAEQDEIVRLIDAAFIWIDRFASEANSARRLIDRLDQTVLAKALRGELVPQDPTDEPASVVLERIRAERGATSKARRGWQKRAM